MTGNVVTVNLQDITNIQTIIGNLIGLSGAVSGDISVPMGVLVGDTTGNRSVNVSDMGQTKARSNQVMSEANFRSDVTADGNLYSSDIGLVKSKSNTSLDDPPTEDEDARQTLRFAF